MTTDGGGADYQLVWPRLLFQNETAALVNNTKLDDWEARCALLLEDAFIGAAPRDDFLYEDHADHQKIFLVNLLRRAHLLREARTGRTPYWSERQRSSRPGADHPLARAVREFVTVVGDLEARGYFENAFDTQLPPGNKDCVDAPEEADPSALLECEIGVADLWPLRPDRLIEDRDLFCNVVEVLHDLVARPRGRTFHSGCGWHYLAFSLEAGRAVYRWQVNQVLDRSDLELRLADEGEDAGRLVAVTDPARMDLASSMAGRTDPRSGDVVRHAIALFRGRNASEHEKRSGVVALAGVLEERRALLKAELIRKDEAVLFDIANNFAIRHRRDGQRADYDPAFLDWVFWWYLATIELTDCILAREEASQSEKRPAPLVFRCSPTGSIAALDRQRNGQWR